MSVLNKLLHPLKNRKRLINKSNAWRITDIFTITTMALAFFALLLLVWFYVRPINTVDIKVPVATDKAEYYEGQEISGIFFGEIYWQGRVEILREVFCKDYRATIKTDEGDEIFKGISTPAKLEGDSRRIGNLPEGAPLGSNCVIQFVNTYHINTPFGDRIISKSYYTQNFKVIVKPSKPDKKAEPSNDATSGVGGAQQAPAGVGGTQETPQQQEPQQGEPGPQGPTGPQGPPAEPVQPPQECAINFGPIKLICD